MLMENNNSNGNNADRELDRLRQILNNKINEKRIRYFRHIAWHIIIMSNLK
jgi:hypothetical protein